MLTNYIKKILLFEFYLEKKEFRLIFIFLLINILYFIIYTLFFLILAPDLFYVHQYYFGLNEILMNFKFNIFSKILPISITLLIEEMVFRGPITLLYKYNLSKRLKLFGSYCLVMVFSFGHLENFDFLDILFSFPNVFIPGFIFTYIYLISGGREGKFIKPILITFIVHLIFDLLIFSIQGVPSWL